VSLWSIPRHYRRNQRLSIINEQIIIENCSFDNCSLLIIGIVMPKLVKTTVNVEGRVSEHYAVVEGDELQAWGQDEEFGIVGYPAPRVDGAARVSGEARYTYDVQLAGMVYAQVLRSPHARARVKRIDVSHLKLLPGVLDVMTYEDAPEISVRKTEKRLLSNEVRFPGQPVAVVVAIDPYTAQDALDMIQVEYEELSFVSDPETALRDDAPEVQGDKSSTVAGTPQPVHTGSENSANEQAAQSHNLFGGKPKINSRGDVEAGLKEADVVVELSMRTPTAVHNALETHGCVAHWEGDQLTIYESTQHVFGVREFAAKKLKLPLSRVRAIGTYMGGGFGAKFPGMAYTLIAATLAKRIRRPVHLMYDREGENLDAGNRGSTVQHIRIGARNDGTLTAIELKAISEGGAAMSWIPMLGGPYLMMYRCPNVHTEVKGVLTNLGSMAAFRAPGFVEATVGLETAMDELAQKLNMDPLELRRKNIPDRDQLEDKPFSSFPVDECYRRGAEAIGWERRSELKPQNGRYRRGIGMSSQIWWGNGGPPAYAQMRLNSDGTATVLTGAQDLGTGARTILAQVAAEEFGLPLDQVEVTIGDTLQGPFGPASGGSGTTGSMAPAVRAAAYELRQDLCDIVAQMHELPKQDIEIRGGIIYRRDEEVVSIKDLTRKLGDIMLVSKGSRGPNPDDVSVVTSGAQFAEVEVDTVTGNVRVLKVVAAHDSGRVVNPQTFNSQIYGGVIQGLGFALTEQRIVDHGRGAVMNPNLEWYKVPTVADVPEIENILIDIPDVRANATGAKGAGEPGIIPTAAAIANAVADALGVRMTELPLTPARVLEALEYQENKEHRT
jgi:xanthine dehydrogenase YagR molybdenum-binding subunit